MKAWSGVAAAAIKLLRYACLYNRVAAKSFSPLGASGKLRHHSCTARGSTAVSAGDLPRDASSPRHRIEGAVDVPVEVATTAGHLPQTPGRRLAPRRVLHTNSAALSGQLVVQLALLSVWPAGRIH
eukprot:scaffold4614_cov247-Pinguiococcus_pyrenoidosus.AAC.13